MIEDPGEAPASPLSPGKPDLLAQLAATRHALDAAEARAQADHERAQLLRGELQHRVRNMLAVVRSIFARSVAAGGTLEDVADHFRGRLDVLARYQNAGITGPGGSCDFETMVRDELQSVQAAADLRVTCEGPEVRLPQASAQIVGLALHELVTNSIKFGTLSLPPDRGTLAIRWRVEDDFHVHWEERGMAVLGSAPLRHGFGREFIEQALPYQLGARTALEIRAGAVSCDIHVPLWDNESSDSEDLVAS